MKVFIKGLNVCPHRRQNLLHLRMFMNKLGHKLVDNPNQSNVILCWTCGFRQDVIDNSIEQIVDLQKKYDADVVALGCLPDIDNGQLSRKFTGTIVPWRKEEVWLEEFFSAPAGTYEQTRPVFCEEALCEDAAQYRQEHPDSDALFADQFFKLMVTEGCPYKCTYCTELLAFPPFRSFSPADLIATCKGRINKEGQERIILIGDCLGQYGRDIKATLPELIRILKKEFPRVTFGLQNYHPIDMYRQIDDICEFIKAGWIEHLNLPVQSGSDRILDKMGRQYTRAHLMAIFDALQHLQFRKYDTHIIVGFPGETEKDFMETVRFVKKFKPTYALVSRYYDAPNAPASKLDGKIGQMTITNRLNVLEQTMIENGIIYNIDGAGVMKERLERINRIL